MRNARTLLSTLGLAVVGVLLLAPRAAEADSCTHYGDTGCDKKACCGNLTCSGDKCVCATGQVYSGANDICITCGASGQTCCPGSTCNLGYVCGSTNTCVACGASGQLCCSGGTCNATLGCNSSGNCVTCGGSGQPCCTGSSCNAGFVCNSSSTCTACGASGQPCCASSLCNAGLSCSAGTCGACTPQSDTEFCGTRQCGSFSGLDNCNTPRTVASCGTCTAPYICGGDGTANMCRLCTPESDLEMCQRLGKNCGTFSDFDRCGNPKTATCPTPCPVPQVCGAITPNVCGCSSVVATCVDFPNQCAAALVDGCGNTLDCSANCTAPQSCNGSGTSPGYCSCDGTVCATYGWACGNAPGCTNAVSCGTCTGTDQCVNNHCQSCIDSSYNARACATSTECCQDVSPLMCIDTKCCVTDAPVCCGSYCDTTYTCSGRPGPGIQHFTGESIIIGNDCSADEMLAYGFVYRLLQSGIAVSWAIDRTKTSQAGIDITLPTGTTVDKLTWTSTGGSWAAMATPKLTYQAGPFIVNDPASVIKLKAILDGTRTWAQRACFAGNVNVYRVNTTFDAPVYATLSEAPGIFMLHDPRSGALAKELSQGFGCPNGGCTAGATCDPEGNVWKTITATSEITARKANGDYALNINDYSGFWTSKYGPNDYYSADEMAAIRAFVDAGGTLMAQSDSLNALENSAAGNLQTSGGVAECTPTTSLVNYLGEPEMQMCPDGIFKDQGGWKGWYPLTTPGWRGTTTNPTKWVRIYVGDTACTGFSGGQKDGNAQKGWMYYMQGHSSVGGGQHVNVKRILLGVLLKQSGNIRTPNVDRIIARSAPVVDETAAVLYQGTRKVNCDQRTTFGGGSACGFLFPYYKGDATVTATSTLGTGTSATTITYADIAGSASWDPAVKLAAQVANEDGSGTRPKRWIFTAVGSGSTWTRKDFIAANASELSTATLNTGLSSTDTASLIASVRTGGFGGVDHATPAIIEPHSLSNASRPTIAYIASLDGMLHAICADTNGCIVNATTYQIGEEVWAFIPPTQLTRLKSNSQGLDASPRVEDLQAAWGGGTVRTWRTILALAEGSYGTSVYALDITNPEDPQLLWRAYGTPTTGTNPSPPPTMGSSHGAALGMAPGTPQNARVWVTSNLGGTGNNGLGVFALNAADGAFVWSYRVDYGTRKFPGMAVQTPNDIPAPPALAPTSMSGALDRLFIGDFDGKVWMLDAGTGATVGTNPLFTTPTAGQPIGAPLAVMRTQTGNVLKVVAGTGGADWTPAGPLGSQFHLYVINTADRSYRTIGSPTIPVGERIYAQPVVRGQEVFAISTSNNMYDQLDCESNLTSGTGTMYRANLENTALGITTVAAGTMVGFDVGASSGAVFAGGLRGATRAPSTETASGASTTTGNLQYSVMGGKPKVWLQRP